MTQAPGRYVVDTSVYSEILRGDVRIADRLETLAEVLVCPVVEGELVYGAVCSQRVDHNLSELAQLLFPATRTVIGHRVAILYGHVRQQLRACGRPIPDNDIWVAACAMAEDATLVTRDEHFLAVEGLTVERW